MKAWIRKFLDVPSSKQVIHLRTYGTSVECAELARGVAALKSDVRSLSDLVGRLRNDKIIGEK